MRRLCLTLTLLYFYACTGGDEKSLPQGTGKTGDIVVVMDSIFWNGASGEAVVQCFSGPQEGLPQAEPLFNVIRLTPENFKQLFKTTKNIIVIKSGAPVDQSKYALIRDQWAQNQLVLVLFAEEDGQLATLIEKNCENLTKIFNSEELSRLQVAYQKLRNLDLIADVEKNIGVSPHILSDYRLVKRQEGLVWLRKDFEQKGHQVSMGLFFCKRPYMSEGDFEVSHLIVTRNEIIRVVGGPEESSHMVTYTGLTPVETVDEVRGHYVKLIRGLWSMEGAFMGGPFIHQVFVDKSGTQLIYIDGYVYAPGLDKREFLRELEVIARSAVPE